jgi:hypothetical protein
MALFHGGEDSVPIALDVGTVRVKVCLEPCRGEDMLTNCDLLRNRDSDADRNDAQICDDFHSPIVIATMATGRFVISARWTAPKARPGKEDLCKEISQQ